MVAGKRNDGLFVVASGDGEAIAFGWLWLPESVTMAGLWLPVAMVKRRRLVVCGCLEWRWRSDGGWLPFVVASGGDVEAATASRAGCGGLPEIN